jgi:hypothetical protein
MTISWCRASLTGLALAAGLAAPAALAAPAGAATDPTDAISLSWDGAEYGASTTESFLGLPVSVPGDTATRTLTVRNDGPRQGVLTAEIVDVELLDPAAADPHGDFYDDLTLAWETADGAGAASFTTLDADGGRQIGELPLGRGQTTEVTLTYEFPYDATSGNRANVAVRQASFDVLLTIRGDDAAAPPAGPTRPSLPTTGADVLWLGTAAVLAVAAGLAVRGRAGRRQVR